MLLRRLLRRRSGQLQLRRRELLRRSLRLHHDYNDELALLNVVRGKRLGVLEHSAVEHEAELLRSTELVGLLDLALHFDDGVLRVHIDLELAALESLHDDDHAGWVVRKTEEKRRKEDE